MANSKTITVAASMEPAVTRRRMLLGLAAASTAAATAGIPTPAESAEASENSELIRLGDDLPKYIATFEAARIERRKIIAEWEPKWPMAPDIITEIPAFSSPFHCEKEVDMFGRPITRPGEKHTRLISRAWHCESAVKTARRALRSKKMAQTGLVRGMSYEQWEDILNEAVAVKAAHDEYTCAIEEFYFLSGYKTANAVFGDAADRLVAHVNAILRQQEYSMAGVLVKAQAISLQADPDLSWRALVAEGGGLASWGAELAASIIGLAGEGRA
jgi:hypothetical protein